MNNQPHLPESCRPTQMLYKVSSGPTPTPLFVLRFVFSIIHRRGRAAKNGEGLGRLIYHMMYTQGGHVGGGGGGGGEWGGSAQLQICAQ